MTKNNQLKLLFLILWIGLFTSALTIFVSLGIPLSDYPRLIQNWIQNYGIWGGVVYVLIYLIRPLLFVPATLLTAVSGLAFGPWWGILYTIIGENISANLTFLIGRFFGKEMVDRLTSRNARLNRIDCAFRDNGFMSVFVMRLTHLPFDLVGFLSGACSLRHRDFALGTFIGILPGLITFVLLGASFTDPRNLLLVIASLVTGLLVSKWLKANKNQIRIDAMQTQRRPGVRAKSDY